MSESYADQWTFENPNSRDRASKSRGPTEVISFRMSASHFRMLDEILQSGIDPRLKTKSDIMQDAVLLFIEDWNKHYQDGISGRQLRILQLEREQDAIDSRERYLTNMDSQIDNAMKYKDEEALNRLLNSMKQEREDSDGFSPKSYLRELDDRIEHLRDLLQLGLMK